MGFLFFILTPEFCLLTSILFTRYDSRDTRYLLGLTEKGNSYTIKLKAKFKKTGGRAIILNKAFQEKKLSPPQVLVLGFLVVIKLP